MGMIFGFEPGGFLFYSFHSPSIFAEKNNCMSFNAEDEKLLAQRGMSVKAVLDQIHQFVNDTHPSRLERPCTVGDGILMLNASDCISYQQIFEQARPKLSIQKMVLFSICYIRVQCYKKN